MKKTTEIDYQSSIYLQLREVIRNKIEEGEYLPGTAIPSENTLADTYGINRLTVRNAIDVLVNEGLLKRVQGKGVYVMTPIERDLEVLGGFSQTMTDKNLQPKKKILQKGQRLAGRKYAEIFGIGEEDSLYYIKRLDYAEDEAIALQEIFIPYNLVPKVEGIDLSVFSMFEIYKFYGINPIRAWQTLDLVRLTQADARLLDITKEQTVFLFSCLTYDEDERVIEYSRSYTRGDKCNFTVHFHK
ncbi:GntR family transcriptional regulator [Anaerosacchariphilus polymeriproducens]|uniref:GntR family transcriptional regulator n=1 Tax=Anaerosacchariphilus polymeriproducens TaxID=1812858 RepID=A0A371AWC2_9FIRM|nr:GntR family transcriptional regulator [Anaerosacchariphilus polymeriproducens]RDU23841.1 GntR family transcriptional regulator [Anaerosacchariphilus polymeriproducens]